MMGKNRIIGLVGIGLIPLTLSGCSTLIAPYEPTSSGCIQQLEYAISVAMSEAESNETLIEREAFIEKFEPTCHINPNDNYGHYLLGKYTLETATTDEDFRKAASLMKQATKSSSGYTPVYIAGIGSVSSQTQMIKTGPGTKASVEAQYELGRMYVEGIGVKQNLKRGMKWLNRAAANGNAEAISLLQTLALQDG